MDRCNSNKSEYQEFTSMTVSRLSKGMLPTYQPQHLHQCTCPVHTSSRKKLRYAAECSQNNEGSALSTGGSYLVFPYLSWSQSEPGQGLKERSPTFVTETKQSRNWTEHCSTNCKSTGSEETCRMNGLSIQCRSRCESSARAGPRAVFSSVSSNSGAASMLRTSSHPIKDSEQVVPWGIDMRNDGDREPQCTPMKSDPSFDSKSTMLRLGQFDGTDSVEDVEMIDIGEHDEILSSRPSGAHLRDLTHTSDNNCGYSDGDILMQDAHSVGEALNENLDIEQQSNDKDLTKYNTTSNGSKVLAISNVQSSQKSIDSGTSKDIEAATTSFHRKDETMEPNALALSKHAQAGPGKPLSQISPARVRRKYGDYCSNIGQSIRVTSTTTTITIDGGRLLSTTPSIP